MDYFSSLYRNRFKSSANVMIAAILCSQLTAASPATAHDDADCRPRGNEDCGQHNMMLVGSQAAFISHLPMFQHEHRFQFIARALFTDGRRDLGVLYTDDRANNPDIRMYTVSPEDRFAMSRLFTPTDDAERRSFKATVFRGHLERGGVEIEGLEGISVDVLEIAYAHELTGAESLAPQLQYILFGSDDEFYLAHRISAAPDFDQLVAVSFTDESSASDVLQNGAVVTFPDRQNSAADRIKTGEQLTGQLGEPSADGVPVTVTVEAEYYFEEGELLVQPTFRPTELELEAGF